MGKNGDKMNSIGTPARLSSSMISVQISGGETRKTFIVHEALLGDRSERLHSILSNTRRQDSHKFVALKDVDSQVFALYIQYLYTGHIPSKPSQIAPGADDHSILYRLYVFAHAYQDIAAQNAACDAIHTKAYKHAAPLEDALPRSEHIQTIYNNTSEPCAARRLIVDIYAAYANSTWMRKQIESLPPQFTRDLALKLMDIRSSVHKREIVAPGKYHVVAREELMTET